MKVLHIIDSGGLYGAETMLLGLVQEQLRLGFDPLVLSIGDTSVSEKPLEAEARSRSLPVEAMRMRAGLNLPGAYRIVRFAKDHQFDVLHTHGYKGDILMGLIPRRIRRLPVVCTLHGWIVSPRLSYLTLYQWLDREMLRRLDAVVAVNEPMLRDLRVRKYRIKRLYTINNGLSVDWDMQQRKSGPGEGLPPLVSEEANDLYRGGFVIGAIGRLAPEKGFDCLIRAVQFLSAKYPDVKAVILGEGPCRSELQKQIAEAGLNGKVLMPGYRMNCIEHMKRFGVFVLSSVTEGLPMTILEAMYARVPIVATRVGGVPDALAQGSGGLLVEPSNPEALAAAIERIYKREIQADVLTNFSYDRLLSDYTSDRMARRYTDVYQAVIGLRTE
jgi:glycosyltransferase involved in cell wall biosynthesis